MKLQTTAGSYPVLSYFMRAALKKINKTKVLFTLFILLILTSILVTYYKMLVARDFEIIDDTEEAEYVSE